MFQREEDHKRLEMAQPTFDDTSRMLAQANLHRMRGQWDEAIAVCMDAMRIAPNNPTAHSLLGDIYSDQGNLDEAIRWYCMALDLRPGSLSDRAKLSQLVENKRQSLIAADQKDPHTTLRLRRHYNLVAKERASLKHGRVWKADKAVRYAAITAFVAMILVIIAAPIVNYERQKHQETLGGISLGGGQINVPPVYYQPISPVKGVNGDSVATVGPTTMRDPFDQKLVDSLNNDTPLLYQGIQIADAQSDPRSNRVTLTFLDIPRNAPTGNLRSQVLANSLRLAAAAAQRTSADQISQFTIRCLLMSAPQAQDSGASLPPMTNTPITASTPLVFVADITRSTIPAGDPGQQTDSSMESLFTSPWFSPSLH